MNQLSTLFITLLTLAAVLFLANCQQRRLSGRPKPFRRGEAISEKLQPLLFSEVRPQGWIRGQIGQNLAGFTGRLDSLAPDLIIQDDIFGKDRLSEKIKHKDVGAITDNGEWLVQFLWWNSETQGNWWDGYLRSAVLAADPGHLKRVEAHVQRLLATQDPDGYLGIYEQDLRYRFKDENGELWAKATALRGLLAWYEYKRDPELLRAVEKAVRDVMRHYPAGGSQPFYSVQPHVGGLSHGLVFTDVLERLYQLTGNAAYRDYCLFLYQDFSSHTLEEDAQLHKAIDGLLPLKGHGVHAYEHLRPLAAACYASGDPQLRAALEQYLKKIQAAVTPSGGPAGDEWVAGRKADATGTGYEYCSIHELMHGYADLLAKTGDAAFGDGAERLFFNAAQGARHPQESSIAYLKTDNSYFMNGPRNDDTTQPKQTRYKYSPVHQDAAVCCVPNAGRIAPYYVQNMWMRDDKGLVATLLGPCELSTTWNGAEVRIREKTTYPFDHTIAFEISTDRPAAMQLRIRKPAWSRKFNLSLPCREENGYLVIEKTWSGTETVTLTLFPELSINRDPNEEYYYSYGALVLARPIAGTSREGKQHPLPGFRDLYYEPVSHVVYQYVESPVREAVRTGDDPLSVSFTTSAFNPITAREEAILLQPMGNTILRQVTFRRKE